MDTQRKSWILPAILSALVLLLGGALAVSVALLNPAEGDSEPSATDKETPAHVEHMEGSDIARVTLSGEAAERLDVQTARTRVPSGQRSAGALIAIIPYGALLYDADGDTWVYTSPEPLVFERAAVTVDRIRGDRVYLTEGPPIGTKVVSVGAPELFGAEFGVGH